MPFAVGNGYQLLLFEFHYEPKVLKDMERSRKLLEECYQRYRIPEYAAMYPDPAVFLPLKNLLTLSVFAPDGYLGCGHRPGPDLRGRIGEREASYGFLPHLICSGIWEAVLNVHCVVTDQCSCSLRVFAVKRGETV